jgi:tetratricopeptide (TPR) repeat protein
MSLFLLQGSVKGAYFKRMFSSPLFQFRFWGLAIVIASSIGSTHFAEAAPAELQWKDWQQAKNLYDSEKFQDAALELQKNAHLSHDSASYYFNLGTIYYRLGRLGEAVGYLEKANRTSPHDPDIQYNLNLIQNALGRVIGAEKLDPSSTWVEQLADRISLEEVRTTLGTVGILVILLWLRVYLKARSLRRLLMNPACLIALVAFGLTSGVYGIQRWAEASPPAICLSRQVIRSGPGDHFLELAKAEEGSKIRILGPSANDSTKNEIWNQVRYSREEVGWIRASSLLAL